MESFEEPTFFILRILSMPKLRILFCTAAFLPFSVAPSFAQTQELIRNDALPRGILWTQLPPQKSGINSDAIDTLYSDMTKEQHHDLKGIVIVRDGSLVSEHYFNGDSFDTLHDIRSATKSLTSLLMGIAIDKKIIRSVDDPIALYLPRLPKDGKEKIEIKDLLNMRAMPRYKFAAVRNCALP